MLATGYSESGPTQKCCDLRFATAIDGESGHQTHDDPCKASINGDTHRPTTAALLSALICPTGRPAKTLSSPLRRNIFLYGFRKSEVWCVHPASRWRAFWPIVTEREAGCDGRSGDAREFFVRTNGAGADVKACGPDTPTLVSSGQNDLLATGAKEPGPRGEPAISVKTIAQGMPDDSAEPVVPSPCFFIRTGAMGEAFTRHSLRPLLCEGDVWQSSGTSCGENADHCIQLFDTLNRNTRQPSP